MPKRPVILLGVYALVVLPLAGWGCGSTRETNPQPQITAPPSLPAEDCHPLPGIPQPGGTIVFALAETVDPIHAPVPHNVSERLVFRNLYETLVRVDCEGRLQPGLADSWTSHEGDRIWVFTLRPGAYFWDGTRVLPRDVKDSWIAAESCPRTEGDHSPLIWLNARAESVQVMDERRLAIHLPEPQYDFPLLLAHAALAVAVIRPGWQWPVGSGSCRLEPETGPPDPDVVCLPNQHYPRPPVWDQLVFRQLPDEDPRDILGHRCDALIVRDQSTLNYFRRTAAVTITPLPWDRLYLLLCPPDRPEEDRQRWYTGWQRGNLARDVVGADALPTREPYFQLPTEKLCPQLTGPIATVRGASSEWEAVSTTFEEDMILHPADDADARRLAERLAVLAAQPRATTEDQPGRGPLSRPYPPGGGQVPQAVAVPRDQFLAAIQSERAGAYVLPVDRCYASACLQLSALLSMSAWLQQVGLDVSFTDTYHPPSARPHNELENQDLAQVVLVSRQLAASGAAVPMVVTRANLVARGRLAGLRFAYDGTILLDQAGWYANAGSTP